MTLLQVAYVLDAAVSFPIALATLAGNESVARVALGEKLPVNSDVHILVGSLWMAIAMCSAAGIFFPLAMAAVLVLQLIYKGLWIVLFVMPRCCTQRSDEVPWRMATMFLGFVIVYPVGHSLDAGVLELVMIEEC